MKFSNPQFVTVEDAKDVQTKRDASGDVFSIEETEMQGIVAGQPSGRRRYPNQIAAFEAYISMELGRKVKIVDCDEPEALPEPETKPAKPKAKAKRKPAKRK